ncbi:hypothetical protein T07_6430 [Trichinella nelsoni]|uniref:Uncharacterized protein n=1 Tax=Trichinella nelsoni TaxID=6336 RepID=A0A0V0RG24_9BILA|nr:hypothetical protein T07_6430 [Trichinella nelsoni]
MNIHYKKWDVCAASTLSLRRLVLRLRSRKHHIYEPWWGLSFSSLFDPRRFWDSFCVRFYMSKMHNHLFLPIARCTQYMQPSSRFTPGMGLPSSGLIWNSVGLASKLKLLFHARLLAYITIQAFQHLLKLSNVLAGRLLWFPFRLATDEIETRSMYSSQSPSSMAVAANTSTRVRFHALP